MTQLHRQMRKKSAFSVSADDMKRLSKILQAFGPDLWNVELSDGTVMERIALDAVLAIPNGSARVTKVVAVATEASASDELTRRIAYSPYVTSDSTKAMVVIEIEGLFSNASVEVSGEEGLLETFWKQIHDWLLNVRPSYSWLANTAMGFPITKLAISVVLGVFASQIAFAVLAKYLTLSATIFITLSSGVAVIFGGGYILDRVQSQLFPLGEFAFGHGEERKRTRQTWRFTLGFGFLLAVLSSIVASVIYARF